MAYKISICIPTFNRAGRLDCLLAQICPMVEQCEDPEAVEICVSDNGSTDQTGEVLNRYGSRFPFLSINQNKENIGFGKNLWKTAHMARGNYIYFTGDDDLFCPDGIKVLLKNISVNNIDLILFGSHPTRQSLRQEFASGEKIILESLVDYLNKAGIFYASFIGNLCFKRSTFMKHCDIGEAVYLSAYPHIFPVLRILRRGKGALVNSPITVPDNSGREWHKMQPIYTSVDMARIMKEEVIPYVSRYDGRSVLRKLGKSLPRGLIRYLTFKIKVDGTNPYQSFRPLNLYLIYRKK